MPRASNRFVEGAPRSSRITWNELGLGAVVLGSAMALGAVHATVLCIVATAAAAVLAWMWWSADALAPRTTASTLLWVCLGLTAFTLFQCIPLPIGLVGALAPQNADVWARSLTPLHENGPSFATLSLDPGATRVEVLRGVTYAAVFLAAARVASSRSGAFVLSCAVVVTALALGIAALLHPAFGTEKVFGIYRPEQPIPTRHVAPLLNPNTLAGYVTAGFALALAQAIAPRPQVPRYASGGAALFLVVMQVWIASRGGILTLGVAALAVLAMSRASRSHTNRSMRADVVALGVLAGVAIAMIALASADDAWTELASKDLSKFSLFKNVLLTVRRFPIFGLGRGAFQSVFPADRQGIGFYVFTHPENVVLQWATEWGIPVAIAGLGAIAWSLRPRVALARGHVAVGPWAALFAVGLHNMVDFSSETPGVMIALVVCAAIVTGGSSGDGKRSRWHAWGNLGRKLPLAAAAVTALAILLVVPGIGDDLYGDRSSLHDAAYDTSLSRDGFLAPARAAMLRHPAEPYLPFMGAVRVSRMHEGSVIPWAERVLERAPVYGPVHIFVARELRTTRPAQARVEYRYALTDAPEYAQMVPAEAASLVHDADDAFEIAPAGTAGVWPLVDIESRIRASKPATAWQIGDEIVARDPSEVSVWKSRAQAALSDLAQGDAAPWCADRQPCIDRVLEASARVIAIEPSLCDGHRFHAQALAESGKVDEALDELSKASDETADGADCLKARVTIAEAKGSEAAVTAAIDDLVKRGCSSPDECVDRYTFAAQVEAKRGSLARALAFEKKGYELAPECDGCLANAAGYASQLGLHAEAMDAYAKLSRLHPDDASYARAEQNERNAMLTPR